MNQKQASVRNWLGCPVGTDKRGADEAEKGRNWNRAEKCLTEPSAKRTGKKDITRNTWAQWRQLPRAGTDRQGRNARRPQRSKYGQLSDGRPTYRACSTTPVANTAQQKRPAFIPPFEQWWKAEGGT